MESQHVYSFQNIADCLYCGRELEFSYRGKQYSVTNSNGYWMFCCDTDHQIIKTICLFEEKDQLISYFKNASIEGTLIFKIFDENLYDASSVCIL